MTNRKDVNMGRNIKSKTRQAVATVMVCVFIYTAVDATRGSDIC